MGNYTLEQVRRIAASCYEEGQYVAAEMLRAYAAALAQNTPGEAVVGYITADNLALLKQDDGSAFGHMTAPIYSRARSEREIPLYAGHAERARVPDSDRIDWMEANARSVSFGKAPQQGYWVHVQGADSVYSHNESLRGAIDSARGAQAAQLAAATTQPEDAE